MNEFQAIKPACGWVHPAAPAECLFSTFPSATSKQITLAVTDQSQAQ